MIYTDHPAITFWSDYLREFEKAAVDSQAIYKVWWRNEFKEGTNEGKQQKRLWDRFVHSPEITNITTFRRIGCWLAESGTGGKTHLEQRRMGGSPVNDRGNTSIIWQRFQLPAAATGRTDYMFAGKRFRTIRDS